MDKQTYISFPFTIHAWTHKAKTCDEYKQIQDSIFLILSTHVKERIMSPSFGSCLKDYIFALQQEETKEMIRREVIASLSRWEPRIQNIQLSLQFQNESVLVNISYSCIRDGRSGEVQYTLQS